MARCQNNKSELSTKSQYSIDNKDLSPIDYFKMEERLEKVTLDDFELYYEVYGEGDTVVLCFHGNSRSAEDFKFLEQEDRKIISIHLFLHQHSTFSSTRIERGDVKVEHVDKLLEKILEKEHVNQFHWLAFSQGGRFTFALFPFYAERVLSLTLIAPDGLDDKNFYSWTQRNFFMRALFRFFLRHPNILLSSVKVLVKIRLLHPKLIEFMDFYTSDKEVLEMAYKTWSSFRNIRPDVPAIKKSLNKYKIPIRIIIGKHDQIIKAKTALKLLKKLDRADNLEVIPYGHNVFKPHIIPELKELLDYGEEEDKNSGKKKE